MSRVGKQELKIPQGCEVAVANGIVSVKGPKGTIDKLLHKEVIVSVEEDVVRVTPKHDTILATALWGTFASHIQNMLHGVTEGFQKQLEIEGVGYRAGMSGTALELLVGFSHPVKMEVPEGLTVAVEKNVITVSGIDKEAVGQFAANVRAVKPPEPYKGKGIHYVGEYIIRKEGKKAK